MTPDQKAYFEYGKAYAILVEARSLFERVDQINRGKGRSIALDYRPLIKVAWDARAVCRRTCRQCAKYIPDGYLSGYCRANECGYTYPNSRAYGCPHFTLREEEEDSNKR